MALFSMSQQYLLLCIKTFLKYIQRIFISTLLMWNVVLPTAFESVRMRGLVAFYSLWSIRAQTQLEIGECETSSGVLLLCLVHTPVLLTADQIQNRNVLVFVFLFSQIIWDFCFSFGSCLQQRKQFEYHTVISLPFWEWHLVFALLWCLHFTFFHLFSCPSKGC